MINIGFWNVRGMNSRTKQFEINKLLSKNNIGLFGLLETRIKKGNMVNTVFTEAGRWSVVTNYNQHKGGRIWLIWDSKLFDIDILNTYSQCIHVRATEKSRT